MTNSNPLVSVAMAIAFADFLGTIENACKRTSFTLDIVGNDQLAPAFSGELMDFRRDRGLEGNVFLRGRTSLRGRLARDRGASVFVRSSHYKGFGIVGMKAANFRLPIIMADGGTYSIIFPVGDRAALRKQLEHLHPDSGRRAVLSAKAAEGYRRSNTWEQTGSQIEAYPRRLNDVPAIRPGAN